jgi:hypothetical protein
MYNGKIDSYHSDDFHQLIEKEPFEVLIKFVSAGRQRCQYKSRTYRRLGHFVIL